MFDELIKRDEELKKEREESYRLGVTDTLAELREVYGEGLEETDLWIQFMEEEAGK